MKNKIVCTLAVIILFSTGVLFAGGKQEYQETPVTDVIEADSSTIPSDAKEEPIDDTGSITITDDSGREVTLEEPAKRIAFSHPSTAEALKIVDAWDNVVAMGSFQGDDIIFPNIETIPVISQMPYNVNYEKLFELDVDLLIAPKISMGGLDELIAKLEPNIPVAVLTFHHPSSFEANLEKLGVLLGKEDTAAEYLEWYGAIISSIAEKTAHLEQDELTTYFQKQMWTGSMMTFTDAKEGIPLRNKITGSINVAADIQSQNGWAQSVDLEWLASQDIDVIFSFENIPNGYGIGINDNTEVKNSRETAMENPIFAHTEAVKQGRFYMITGDCWSTPRNIIGFAYLAKWFHPELFQELEPKAIHQEYLTRFMDVEYDLDKQGVFVYPEL